MIAFPVIQSLSIKAYGLFPASSDAPFITTFRPGPNAIVGVNGSGKSTFIGIALRCLTGPFTLPAPTSEHEFGQVRPRVVHMSRPDRQLFARRVADGAANATATLYVTIAGTVFAIERSLSDLSLVSCAIGSEAAELAKEEANRESWLQGKLSEAFGVATFFDVLIILRFLVFMLEDRRALVWDPTAQRQIFRVMLPSDRATEYAEAQLAVVSADSAVRNTQSLITRHEGQAVAAKKRAKNIADAEAERRVLVKQAEVLREQGDAAAQARLDADKERHAARLERLKSAETRETTIRELERFKMESLSALLGPSHETLKYIVGHLLAEHRCLVCGTDPSPAAPQIDERVRHGECPVCGSKFSTKPHVTPLTDARRAKIARLEKELALAEQQITLADEEILAASARLAKANAEYEALERQRVSLDARIVAVLRKIPTERAAIGSHENDLDALRRILKKERTKLTETEERFRIVVAESVKNVQAMQDEIADSFQGYLKVFLREKANLVYQTVKDRVGQGGASFEFPAFHLSMTGGAVAGETMRDSPGEVSQSQAEFIDLAFRMAIMSVAGNGPATLVVDAPEASLDFLFAERAGQQLAKFSRSVDENRVIVTSYLPSHHLLMSFFQGVRSEREREARIVNLIRDAAPNAAVRADRAKYEEFLSNVIARRS